MRADGPPATATWPRAATEGERAGEEEAEEEEEAEAEAARKAAEWLCMRSSRRRTSYSRTTAT